MVIEELINKYRSNLNSTDMMIWKYIYNNKKKCRNMTINELAKRCNVSRTTILRFAKKLSLDGYSHLKSILKNEDNYLKPKEGNEFSRIVTLYKKVCDEMNNKDFNKINELLFSSKRIYAYGTGSFQRNLIRELKRLLMTTGKFVFDIDGSAEIDIVFENISKEDLVIIVSLSGETSQALEFASKLKLKGIPVISITQLRDNPLASLSTENVYISTLQFNLTSESSIPIYHSITSF
ncbi:MAG: MurR/RpiR family transcriptional regulator, partial [Clostridiaceae bacterium]